MKLRSIKTELDYQNALQEIEQLFDAEPNSPECDLLFHRTHIEYRNFS